jgi:adenylate cyclase
VRLPRSRPGRWRRIAQKIAIVVLSAVFVSLLLRFFPQQHQRIATVWWDLLARATPYEIQNPLVQIVDIDDTSLATVGGRPWSRRVMADLLDRLREAGAAVVGFDLGFAGPSPDESAATGAEIDERFAEAIRRMPVVTGFEMTQAEGNGDVIRKAELTFSGQFKVKNRIYFQEFKPVDHLYAFPEATVDLPKLQAAASGVGYANVGVDSAGIIRRASIIATLNGKPVPSFAAEVVRITTTASSYFVTGSRYGLNEVLVGKIPIRTDRAGNVWLRYAASRPDRFIHAADILSGRFERDRIAGHIVLVGVSAPSLGDQWPTPLGVTMPGVELLAQLIEEMLRVELLSLPNWIIGLELFAALAASTLIVAVSWLGRAWAISIGVVSVLLTAVLSALGYTRWHVLIDPIWPTVMLAMVIFGAVLIDKPTTTERRRSTAIGPPP